MLYQHGTLANLVPGGFAGTQTLAELLTHGDTGIGTLTGLDGELIILAGVVYQVDAQGAVRQPALTERVPFANVHPADFAGHGLLTAATAAETQAKVLTTLGTANAFAAVRVHGTFARMRTRVVAKQVAPYPTLTATAAAQRIFDARSVTGTLIGYYSPTLYAGMAAPGFHLHFLSDAHDFGGHVLDWAGVAGVLETELFADVQLHLPIDDPAFMARALDGPDVLAAIQQAEQ
ncbi:acetolactate decarboxylase [Lacticaseibacillus absianus]|uniref:acetolactate decarboxylase n=1 Tax=Lacticaseibacillus absianus TaxID=2729623 RepID=UPI0015CDBCD8|nr:acetolactate decarboxylase [Lacticaseibacillus absianus]